jgi:flavin reductase (DIM6/NTAB) family NADH-FMN oxidoreductase RutF
MNFKEILPELLKENPFKLIGEDWMLITAGTPESFNMMTASWGGLGVLWNKNVVICFVRPTRHTFEFLEKSQSFTLSFFGPEHRNILDYCGAYSGRDVNKIKETNLTPVKSSLDSVYFEEARLVLECKKIYFNDLNPGNFLDNSIMRNYQINDYHRMYIGEIHKCLIAGN